MPKLFIVEGGQESVFELLGDDVTIGRGAANAVQVFDTHASKHHAVVRTTNGRPKLIDLESKNGTRVNGAFKNQRVLEHGDTIAIGAAILRYDASDVPAVTVRAPARPVVAVAGAPAALAAAPSAPARTSSARRRDRDRGRDRRGDDEDDDGPRGPAPRRNNNTGVMMLVGAGGVLFLVIAWLMLANSGRTASNAAALGQANRLANQGRYKEALAVLDREADPSEVDGYVHVRKRRAEIDQILKGEDQGKREDEANRYFKTQILNPYIEMHKNQMSDAELARRIRDFVSTYKGTVAVMEFENSPHGKYPELRALMKAN